MNKKNPDSGMGRDTDCFAPSSGDVLLELKTQIAKRLGKTYIWRMIVTGKDVKKIWPDDNDDSECPHEDVLWAIDSKVRPITLCEECGEFAFGHKEEV
jgi:hypothetical protein